MARYYLCNSFRALVINTSDDALDRYSSDADFSSSHEQRGATDSVWIRPTLISLDDQRNGNPRQRISEVMEFIQIPLTIYWVLRVIWAQTGTGYSQDNTVIDRNDPWHTGMICPSSGRAAEQVKQMNPASPELRATVLSSRNWAAGARAGVCSCNKSWWPRGNRGGKGSWQEHCQEERSGDGCPEEPPHQGANGCTLLRGVGLKGRETHKSRARKLEKEGKKKVQRSSKTVCIYLQAGFKVNLKRGKQPGELSRIGAETCIGRRNAVLTSVNCSSHFSHTARSHRARACSVDIATPVVIYKQTLPFFGLLLQMCSSLCNVHLFP